MFASMLFLSLPGILLFIGIPTGFYFVGLPETPETKVYLVKDDSVSRSDCEIINVRDATEKWF